MWYNFFLMTFVIYCLTSQLFSFESEQFWLTQVAICRRDACKRLRSSTRPNLYLSDRMFLDEVHLFINYVRVLIPFFKRNDVGYDRFGYWRVGMPIITFLHCELMSTNGRLLIMKQLPYYFLCNHGYLTEHHLFRKERVINLTSELCNVICRWQF